VNNKDFRTSNNLYDIKETSMNPEYRSTTSIWHKYARVRICAAECCKVRWRKCNCRK